MIGQLFVAIATIFVLFVLTVSAETIKSTTSTLAPILFLPGFDGNKLFGTITEDAVLPSSCGDVKLPINQPFELTGNPQLPTECIQNLLTLQFNSTTQKYSSPYKGFSVSTEQFGRFDTISSKYWMFAKIVETWGYERHHNLFGVPYDYRYMSDNSLTSIGFIQQLQELIEKVYHLNNQRKVILIGHSNGGPTMYTFLTSAIINQAWKDKHIAAMIGLSGNFLGQMNALSSYLYNEDPIDQEMECSWESNVGSVTWGGYEGVKDIPIVTTYYNQPEKEKNYTSQLNDLVSLFDSVGKYGWSDQVKTMYGVNPIDGSALPTNAMDRSAHPLVDIYCLYGSNITTTYSYVFNDNILTNESAAQVRRMGGDGDQDIIDNQFCQVWQQDKRPIVKEYHFEAQPFPNVRHMEMYSNKDVMNKVHDIVLNYSK